MLFDADNLRASGNCVLVDNCTAHPDRFRDDLGSAATVTNVMTNSVLFHNSTPTHHVGFQVEHLHNCTTHHDGFRVDLSSAATVTNVTTSRQCPFSQ